jgi:hypothetical protein
MMTEKEIKERNTALATYMGWAYNESEECWQFSDGTGWIAPPDPPFHTDMNLLMPVVWKLMAAGNHFSLDPSGDGRASCLITRQVRVVDAESPALALWEAVSSLVMELQKQRP